MRNVSFTINITTTALLTIVIGRKLPMGDLWVRDKGQLGSISIWDLVHAYEEYLVPKIIMEFLHPNDPANKVIAK